MYGQLLISWWDWNKWRSQTRSWNQHLKLRGPAVLHEGPETRVTSALQTLSAADPVWFGQDPFKTSSRMSSVNKASAGQEDVWKKDKNKERLSESAGLWNRTGVCLLMRDQLSDSRLSPCHRNIFSLIFPSLSHQGWKEIPFLTLLRPEPSSSTTVGGNVVWAVQIKDQKFEDVSGLNIVQMKFMFPRTETFMKVEADISVHLRKLSGCSETRVWFKWTLVHFGVNAVRLVVDQKGRG